MTTSPTASLVEMLVELRARCPTLLPASVPTGFHDADKGVALLGLCQDAAERCTLANEVSRARQNAGGVCALSAKPVPDASALRFVSLWELQPEKRIYRLSRCTFVCADVALLLDTTAMLERFSRRGADDKELDRLAELFSKINHHSAGPAKTGLEARRWLQECLSLAYAVQVVASNIPGWVATDPDGEPLQAVGSAVALAQRMLGGAHVNGGSARKPKRTKTSAAPVSAADGDGTVSKGNAATAGAPGSSQGRRRNKRAA